MIKRRSKFFLGNQRIPASSCEFDDREMLSVASENQFCSLQMVLNGEESRTKFMRVFVLENKIRLKVFSFYPPFLILIKENPTLCFFFLSKI
jgi:hypothetical protein